MRDKVLLKRGYIESSDVQTDKQKEIYYTLKLINEFGVIIDKPEFLTEKVVKDISNFFGKDIPKGFYSNPQDTKYFSCQELYIEQCISYIQIELNSANCLDDNIFKRNEVFKKVLPKYKEGDEIKIRKFKIVNKQEADKILLNLASGLCLYTRPWAVEELAEFKWLYLNGFYSDDLILCKDNAIGLFLEYKDIKFASMLDKKDIVKMSLYKFGEKQILNFSDEDKTIFKLAINVCKDCPLSLRQAKYYNRILKNIGSDLKPENNNKSIYKKAINLIKSGQIVQAAKVFASSGSLLERNLVFLLSRASIKEAEEIIDLIKVNNPIVLIQLLLGITNDSRDKRVFNFIYNKKLKYHVETDDEFKFRKSILSTGMKKYLVEKLDEIIKKYYQGTKSLGKIYINSDFKKVGLPLNTSAMGMGIDVLPTGSRLPLTFDYLRTFCYWYKVFDIDASVVFVDNNWKTEILFWGNHSAKKFGDSCLSSGDNRNKDGAEYYDFKIAELNEMGYKYAIYTLNGYGGELNQGDIYCGIQNKDNLNTFAFDPKNIEFKIHVKGDSRGYVGFAIDFDNNEIIILNQILSSAGTVVNPKVMNGIKHYLNTNFLESFNMYKILSYMGDVVEDKNEADIIFDFSRENAGNKQIITPFDIEKIVNLLK